MLFGIRHFSILQQLYQGQLSTLSATTFSQLKIEIKEVKCHVICSKTAGVLGIVVGLVQCCGDKGDEVPGKL